MMRYGYNMMGNGNGYSMMGGWLGMMIIPIILFVVFIFVVSRKGQNDNVKERGTKENSLDILSERFARGDINEDEYANKRNILLGHKL